MRDYKTLLREVLKNVKVNLSDVAEKSIVVMLRKFCYKLQKKWSACRYIEEKFLAKNNLWLSKKIMFPALFLKEISSRSMFPTHRQKSAKFFKDISDRHKVRRTKSIRKEYSGNELMFAAKMKMKAEGNIHASKVLDYLLRNPREAETIRNFCEQKEENLPQCSKEKALGMITSLKLSKTQYNMLREASLEDNKNIYPSYYQIEQAKVECYPSKDSISVTEEEAKIKLQSLLDHTTLRILSLIDKKEKEKCSNLLLISKWGL
ncbi:hypothetical protein KPH14_007657 [Odynerus spinipes]|uniref:Uncharacterized protein n=1 Tax=Odynerus spinipes TaxID=1348599 RepID=A0AAD9R8Q9_9HYME|nr:hypothetical protein KPH14_007657 [Odynerus spinipes]